MTEKKRGRPRKGAILQESYDEDGRLRMDKMPDVTESEGASPKKHPGGRPTSYREDMPLKILKYIKVQKDKGSLPTYAGACLALGIHKDTLYSWEKDKEKKEFSDALHTLRLEQEDLLLTGAIQGKFKERSSLFILSSVHGYVERKEEKLTVEGTEASLEQVKALMKAFNR